MEGKNIWDGRGGGKEMVGPETSRHGGGGGGGGQLEKRIVYIGTGIDSGAASVEVPSVQSPYHYCAATLVVFDC